MKVWNAQNADAATILIIDEHDEPQITMDSPKEDMTAIDYLHKILVPFALTEKSFGDDLKKAMQNYEAIIIKLYCTESMPHLDERVEYEFWTNNNDECVEYYFWTNNNDECGPRYDDQMDFVRKFKGHAQILENGRLYKLLCAEILMSLHARFQFQRYTLSTSRSQFQR